MSVLGQRMCHMDLNRHLSVMCVSRDSTVPCQKDKNTSLHFIVQCSPLLLLWKEILGDYTGLLDILSDIIRFLHAIAACFARLSHGPGISPFVRLSVTLLYCVKMVQARITKSSPWAASRSLVFHDKNFVPLGLGGSPQTRVSKRGTPKKMLFPRYWVV